MGKTATNEKSFIKTLLDLGRVSNLLTVWSNCWAALFLSTEMVFESFYLIVFLAGSLMYIGGMFLNDAYDEPFDKVHQKYRPIPSGRIKRKTVFILGFLWLFLGACCFVGTAYFIGNTNLLQVISFVLHLSFFIIIYDRKHKDFKWSPVVMGANRFFLCLAAGVVVAPISPLVVILGASHFLYTIALTFLAKKGLPGKSVAQMIAGMSLLDGLFFLVYGQWVGFVFCGLFFFMTQGLQRWVRGT